jgi:hypothetical protein
MSKKHVSRSTKESRKSHTTSTLAMVESIFLAVISLSIAYYYDFYTHIYIAVALAFFSFLKTPDSTDSANDHFLFGLYGDIVHSKLYVDIFYIGAITIFFITNYFYNFLDLLDPDVKIAFYPVIFLLFVLIVKSGRIKNIVEATIAIIVGVATLIKQLLHLIPKTIVMLGNIENNILLTIILVLFMPLLIIGEIVYVLAIVLKAIILKVFYTLFYTIKHPIKTFLNIGNNCRETFAVNDIFYTPELLPKITKKQKEIESSKYNYPVYFGRDQYHQISEIIEDIKNDYSSSKEKPNMIIMTNRKLTSIILALILTLGYFYRFIIKSTSWLFFSLVYLSKR